MPDRGLCRQGLSSASLATCGHVRHCSCRTAADPLPAASCSGTNRRWAPTRATTWRRPIPSRRCSTAANIRARWAPTPPTRRPLSSTRCLTSSSSWTTWVRARCLPLPGDRLPPAVSNGFVSSGSAHGRRMHDVEARRGAPVPPALVHRGGGLQEPPVHMRMVADGGRGPWHARGC